MNTKKPFTLAVHFYLATLNDVIYLLIPIPAGQYVVGHNVANTIKPGIICVRKIHER
jgi:hypothetical protein